MDEPRDRQPDPCHDTEGQLEEEARQEETRAVLASGPHCANRAGAFAFLAILVVLAAAVYYHFASQGADSFQNRLDAQLINHAELTMAARDSAMPLAVVPSWPHGLYHAVRRDIVVYAALAALAAFFWSRSAAARARRDAFILHDSLRRDIARLRETVARLENRCPDNNQPLRQPDGKPTESQEAVSDPHPHNHAP